VFGEVEEEKKKIDFKLGDTPVVKQENGGDNMETEKAVPAPDYVEVDPLDAFMAGISDEVQELNRDSLRKAHVESQTKLEADEEKKPVDDAAALLAAANRGTKKVLEQVDHSKVEYLPFRKDFYIEVPEIAKMTEEEVNIHREALEDMKIRGKDCPKPIKNFTQSGLSTKILEVLRKAEFEKPTPIQAQALPAIMSGRDVIGIAKTGSGKTLAYLLPLLRHILDQPPLESGDGPVAIIMAPTRELVTQIHGEIKKFKKATGVRSVPVYGGAGVASQIGDLKRGTEIVVCTPGRMIDILCANKGRITNLRRTTYLVLDEADRMFDMGFEPQIKKIINNIRPDRQTVMFSATFPRVVENAARSLLKNPLEITVRGRNIVSDTIDQFVEVIEEEQKLTRLLELIAAWYDKGSILIFVDTQEATDALYRDIIKSGYACLSLHGGKEQVDREMTIQDFRRGDTKILVATSVAARGLDVPSIRLVLNYEVPNHLQDYVHRVGRTGRAGNLGTAITFITPSEEQYSPDLVKALKDANSTIPEKLKELYDRFQEKLHQGTAKRHMSGYLNNSGFKFDEAEEEQKKAERKLQRMLFGGEDVAESDEEEVAGEEEEEDEERAAENLAAKNDKLIEEKAAASGMSSATVEALKKASKLTEELQQKMAKASGGTTKSHVVAEFEINDYPQTARWRVTNKDALMQIQEFSGCNVLPRGQFVPAGRNPPPGEKKLYLLIEGSDDESVDLAKIEIKKILEEAILSAHPDKPSFRKYSVV
jgi:ATP-dependent RNA helicase DDX46/PRP5